MLTDEEFAAKKKQIASSRSTFDTFESRVPSAASAVVRRRTGRMEVAVSSCRCDDQWAAR